MIAPLLVVVFFSASALSASRASRAMGPVNANALRLLIAFVLLGLWAHTFGQGNQGPGFGLFFVSGLVGFGFGDLALFQAYGRIGPRRTILLAQSLAAPFAAVTEWAWMGTRLSLRDTSLALTILAGVCCALYPRREDPHPREHLVTGTLFGVGAALGQAWGAVISRKAASLNLSAGIELDGLTAAWQRIGAGLLVGAAFYVWFRCLRRSWRESGWAKLPLRQRPAALGLSLLNALTGPVLGVGCYQWALTTIPSALVLAIAATTPLFMIPFTWWLDGDRPGVLALVGTLLAVAGVVGLVLG